MEINAFQFDVLKLTLKENALNASLLLMNSRMTVLVASKLVLKENLSMLKQDSVNPLSIAALEGFPSEVNVLFFLRTV